MNAKCTMVVGVGHEEGVGAKEWMRHQNPHVSQKRRDAGHPAKYLCGVKSSGAKARILWELYAALKRRSSTVLRAVWVGIRIKTSINVKGNEQECPFHTS